MLRCPRCATGNPPGSRYCTSCANPLSDGATAVTEVMGAAAGPARASATSSVDEGRFLAGTLLAGRYRITGLLGRGGMGEVYRATDLTLGQTVALKFLPEDTARDDRMLARFHNEVRVARQVSHPNVCRVYDIGVAQGHPYISMEYVDGEDLASLLRRIGRLPADKAVEMARKLCAGIAAAHERGVLHRDLKPANIMIDGRGQLLIMDFGLAAAGEVTGVEAHHGTPTYMAPEQLAGREVTPRSDIYALGLVLYEMFTGRRAFEAASMADLLRLQNEASPPGMTSAVKDLEPAVERVILHCLDPDPKRRPASALAIAAALPGGDPLAAALAAGETPSPEMVAAAGESEGLRLRAAGGYLAVVLAGLVALAAVAGRASLLSRTPVEYSPDILAHQAVEIGRTFGYADRPTDTARGFGFSLDYWRWAQANESREQRDRRLAAGRPQPVYFWYRQSPRLLAPLNALNGNVTEWDPPPMITGMLHFQLDLRGRLHYFAAVPPQFDRSQQPGPSPEWSKFFAAAGLDPTRFTPVEPAWLPPTPFDVRAAWTGFLPEAPEVPLRIEAASWRGRAVYFDIVGPWMRPRRDQPPPVSTSTRVAGLLNLGLVFAVVGVAAFLARHNVRLGRGDTRGALRLGAFTAAVLMLAWALATDHIAALSELFLLVAGLGSALLVGAIVWLLYQALEPYVRRRWPQTLVSWSRVLSGRFHDPLIGADLLRGAALGVAGALLFYGSSWLMQSLGPGRPFFGADAPLEGFRRAVALVLYRLPSSAAGSLGAFMFIFLLLLAARRRWLAAALFVVIVAAVNGLRADWPAADFAFRVLLNLLLVLALMRCGLLGLVTCIFVIDVLAAFPLTLDFSAWYASATILALLIVAALAVYGFRVSLAGRPMLKEEW